VKLAMGGLAARAQRLSASEGGSLAKAVAQAQAELCSTPFGIGGWITRRRTREPQSLIPVCSTPFGIGGWITLPRAARGAAHLAVLNAFRHRRVDHHTRPSRSPTAPRVLNAFRHRRVDHMLPGELGPSILVTSAQRLSASEGGSPEGPKGKAIPGHSACSTPFGIGGWITEILEATLDEIRYVLNAFRHRRVDHFSIPLQGRINGVCSTPFGIGGWITLARGAASAGDALHVLNAFRHRRVDHHRANQVTLGNPLVLNAFRHRRVDHSLHPQIPFSASSVCAQRLSASEGGSRRLAMAEALRQQVLNAFRHRRVDHAHGDAFGADRSVACSTPFGIGGWITTEVGAKAQALG